MEILNQFGVDPKLLLAQVVNFLLLLFVLRLILYKPILKMLEERKQKIADSLKNADEIEKRLMKTEEEREKKLETASKEATQMLEEATKNASLVIEEAKTKAQSDIADLLEKNNQRMKQEREQLYQEIRSELGDMVVIAMEKIYKTKLTKEDQKKIIEETVKDLK